MTESAQSVSYLNDHNLVPDKLDNDQDVPLAHISGKDNRRTLPPDFFQRKPAVFLLKFLFAIALIAAATCAIALSSNPLVMGVAVLANGLMFAHLIELQHECMHGHAFRSPLLNRLFGVACGTFMMSSNAHYRYDHLRHHAWLGTPRNLEHFNYRFSNLHSLSGFTRAFFDLSRYKRVARILFCAFTGKMVPGVNKLKASREIKQEYVFYLVVLLASVIASMCSMKLAVLVVFAWWLPSLLVAEGVHFMIEMPEHFGLNTMTQPDVLSNTRTIRTSWIVHWFVNGNDLHTAHHYHHGVPMCNVRKLHALIADRIVVVEPSYRSLYKDILAGRIKQKMDQACMER
jgi:fatty acid desaturase